MSDRFATGKKAIAECDICGQRCKYSQLKPLVVNTRVSGIMACPECWNPDHPQLQAGKLPVVDAQALRNPRPDTSYYQSGANSLGNPSQGSRIIQWGWNPVGFGNALDLSGVPDMLRAAVSLGSVTAYERG